MPDADLKPWDRRPREGDAAFRASRAYDHLRPGWTLRQVKERIRRAAAASGEHLCLTMRGAKFPARMTTAIFGVFRDDPAARFEFLRLTRNR
jgi:hypothetical protein